jgi:hypothetical protein
MITISRMAPKTKAKKSVKVTIGKGVKRVVQQAAAAAIKQATARPAPVPVRKRVRVRVATPRQKARASAKSVVASVRNDSISAATCEQHARECYQLGQFDPLLVARGPGSTHPTIIEQMYFNTEIVCMKKNTDAVTGKGNTTQYQCDDNGDIMIVVAPMQNTSPTLPWVAGWTQSPNDNLLQPNNIDVTVAANCKSLLDMSNTASIVTAGAVSPTILGQFNQSLATISGSDPLTYNAFRTVGLHAVLTVRTPVAGAYSAQGSVWGGDARQLTVAQRYPDTTPLTGGQTFASGIEPTYSGWSIFYDQWEFNPASWGGTTLLGPHQNGQIYEAVGFNFKSWGADEKSFYDNAVDSALNPISVKTLLTFPDGTNGVNAALHSIGNRPHCCFILRGAGLGGVGAAAEKAGPVVELSVVWSIETFADLYGPRAFLYNSMGRLSCPYIYIPQDAYTMDSAGKIGEVVKQYLRKYPHLLKLAMDALNGRPMPSYFLKAPRLNSVAATTGLTYLFKYVSAPGASGVERMLTNM